MLISDIPRRQRRRRSAPRCCKRHPRNIIVLPVLFEGQVKAVIELAAIGGFTHDADDVP